MDEENKEKIKDKSICVKNYNLAKDFFKDNLSIKEKDKIFAHLLQCKNCLKSYKFYSKAVLNESFSVTDNFFIAFAPFSKLSQVYHNIF